MSSKIKNVFKNILLVVVSLSIAFLIVEMVTRKMHGYKIMSVALWKPPVALPIDSSSQVSVKVDPDPMGDIPELNDLLAHIPLAKGVEKNWFYQSPPPLSNRAPSPNADLVWRDKKAPMLGFQVGHVYNLDYVLDELCNHKQHFYGDNDELNAINSIYVFKDKMGSPYPLFHFLKGTTFPSGLVTNQFGFRGPEIPFEKPPRTIRIAFLGASTTIDQHNYPHAYPEYVGHWLNLWAQAQHLNVKFDIINSGGSGYHSEDTMVRFQNEVLPLQPDIAIYYEGANQFWPGSIVNRKDRLLFHRPTMIVSVPAITRYSAFIADLIMAYNKILFVNAKEPTKPAYTIEFPGSLNEENPDLASKDLPLDFKRSLEAFDTIRQTSAKYKTLFIPTSFVWNVYPGLILHFPHDMYIYSQLNTTFWPFSYEAIHRYAVFQNRVYQKYAEQNHLYFIDIDRYYPRDNALFVDAIHGTAAGIRMLAWVQLQQLIPIIQAQIAAGKLPQTWQPETMPTNYANNKENYLITKEQIMNLCAKMPKNKVSP